MSGFFYNVICFNVLHHIPESDKALRDLHRILAPDGRLIINDYDEEGIGFLEMLERTARRYFQSVSVYSRPHEHLLLICEKAPARME